MQKGRTKREFAEAFMALAEEKEIEKITIQDLLNRCQTSRQTFYNHFRDKYDLISWIYEDMADQILQFYQADVPLFDFIKQMYGYIYQHKTFFCKAIRLEGQNTLLQTVFEFTRKYYIGQVRRQAGEDALTPALIYAVDFNCYGAINMAWQWVQEGMVVPMDEFIELQLYSMPEELKRFFPDVQQIKPTPIRHPSFLNVRS